MFVRGFGSCDVVDLGLVAKLVANVAVRGRSLRIP